MGENIQRALVRHVIDRWWLDTCAKDGWDINSPIRADITEKALELLLQGNRVEVTETAIRALLDVSYTIVHIQQMKQLKHSIDAIFEGA